MKNKECELIKEKIKDKIKYIQLECYYPIKDCELICKGLQEAYKIVEEIEG